MPPTKRRADRPAGFYELRRVIGANLRDHRMRRGWSLDEVTKRLSPYMGNLRTSTISAWESARADGHLKAFTIEEIYAMCRVFDLNIAELMAPPRVVDIEPIGRIAGNEPRERIGEIFGTDEKNIWEVYQSHWLKGLDFSMTPEEDQKTHGKPPVSDEVES